MSRARFWPHPDRDGDARDERASDTHDLRPRHGKPPPPLGLGLCMGSIGESLPARNALSRVEQHSTFARAGENTTKEIRAVSRGSRTSSHLPPSMLSASIKVAVTDTQPAAITRETMPTQTAESVTRLRVTRRGGITRRSSQYAIHMTVGRRERTLFGARARMAARSAVVRMSDSTCLPTFKSVMADPILRRAEYSLVQFSIRSLVAS
jgi:hypothetical protein